ncbi:MAG: T9SS type A sorting domain-containing protein [Crocinitomicaceae bacterium]
MEKVLLSMGLLLASLGAYTQCEDPVDEFIMHWKFGNDDGTNQRFIEDICPGQTIYLYNLSTMNNPEEVSIGEELTCGTYRLTYKENAGPWYNFVQLDTRAAADWPADGTPWVFTVPIGLNIQPGVANFKIQHTGPGANAHNGYLPNKQLTNKLNIHSVTVDAGLDQISCSGDPVILNGSTSGSSYSWTPGNMTSLNPTVNPTSTTSYTLTAYQTFAGGTVENMDWEQVFVTCSESDVVTVNVNQKPSVHPQDIGLCSNDPFPTLDAGPAPVAYQWTFSNGSGQATTVGWGQYLNTNAHGFGIYKLTVWNAEGCSNIATYNIYPDPSSNLNPSFTLNTTTSFGSTNFSMYNTDPNGTYHYWNIANSNSNGDYLSSIGGAMGNYPTYSYNGLPTGNWYLITHMIRAEPCNEWFTETILHYTGAGRRDQVVALNEKVLNQITTAAETELNLNVYPNPATTDFTVSLSDFDSERIYKIMVYGVDGKMIISEQLNSAQNLFDLSQFESGMYFIKVSDGYQTSTSKIIKK